MRITVQKNIRQPKTHRPPWLKKMGLQVAITGCNSAPTILRIGANFNHRGKRCVLAKDAANDAAKPPPKSPPSHRIASADFSLRRLAGNIPQQAVL
jgi:hypothetical protein